MYYTSVQAIEKHKHIIFIHLSTAVDNTLQYAIILIKQFLQNMIKRMKISFCGNWPNYSKKNCKKKRFLSNFNRFLQKCEKCKN